MLYYKILRDADKLDILQLAVTTYWKNELEELSKEVINKEMFIEFCKQKTIDASKIKEKNQLDKLIKTLALIFDIQYKISFKILKERDYFNKIIARFYFTNEETKKHILEIKEIGNKFINSNI